MVAELIATRKVDSNVSLRDSSESETRLRKTSKLKVISVIVVEVLLLLVLLLFLLSTYHHTSRVLSYFLKSLRVVVSHSHIMHVVHSLLVGELVIGFCFLSALIHQLTLFISFHLFP